MWHEYIYYILNYSLLYLLSTLMAIKVYNIYTTEDSGFFFLVYLENYR